jgi:hypothetical protein
VNQVHALELVVTITDPNGGSTTLSHTYGQKVPYTPTFTCTQEFEEPDGGSGPLTVTLAFGPSR